MVAVAWLLGVLVSAVAAGRWGKPGAVPLAICSIAWLLVNGRMEGPLLISFPRGHGLVASDLVGLAGVGLAALVWWFPPVSSRPEVGKDRNPLTP